MLVRANLLVAYREHPDDVELNLQRVTPAGRMQLDTAMFKLMLAESGSEMEALRAALGS